MDSICKMIDYYLDKIKSELIRAKKIHPGFRSYHEGYGVIKEEFDEMWDEIKKRDVFHKRVREECIQLAAMCLKLLEFSDNEEKNDKS